MESSETGERTKLKSPHKLPVQNPNFVGRRTDLTKLHDRLQETKRLAITAVSGMGGIGKTALALQYAYEQADF